MERARTSVAPVTTIDRSALRIALRKEHVRDSTMKARTVDLLHQISSQLPENAAARTRGVTTAACALVLDTLPELERLQFGDRSAWVYTPSQMLESKFNITPQGVVQTVVNSILVEALPPADVDPPSAPPLLKESDDLHQLRGRFRLPIYSHATRGWDHTDGLLTDDSLERERPPSHCRG